MNAPIVLVDGVEAKVGMTVYYLKMAYNDVNTVETYQVVDLNLTKRRLLLRDPESGLESKVETGDEYSFTRLFGTKDAVEAQVRKFAHKRLKDLRKDALSRMKEAEELEARIAAPDFVKYE